MRKTLDTPHVLFELEDGLLTGHYKKTKKFTLETAKAVVKARLEFTGDEPVLGLIYNEGVKSLEKEARNYLASSEGTKGIIAAAYVVDNAFSSFIANFFVSTGKTTIPIRVFAKRDAALKWLEKFKK